MEPATIETRITIDSNVSVLFFIYLLHFLVTSILLVISYCENVIRNEAV